MADKKEIRVAWLSGNMRERKQMLDKIKAQIGEHELSEYGSEVGFSYLESQITSYGCFDEAKVIVLTSLPTPVGTTKETMKTKLKKLLENIPPNRIVIFNGIKCSEEKMISDHVRKIGKVFEFDDKLPPYEAEKYVMSKIVDAGKATEQKFIAEFIRNMDLEDGKAISVDLLDTYTLHLLQYIGKRKTINVDDIRAISKESDQVNEWKMLDALTESDYFAASNLVEKSIAGGKSIKDTVEDVFRMATWQFRLFFFIKEALANGRNQSEACKDAATLAKLVRIKGEEGEEEESGKIGWNAKYKAEKQAYSDFVIQKALGNGFSNPLEHFSRGKLFRMLAFLQKAADLARMAVLDAECMLLCDMFLLLSCDKLDDKMITKLWRYFGHE